MASDVTSKIYDSTVDDIKSKFAYLHKILDQKEKMIIAKIMDSEVSDTKSCMAKIQDLTEMNEFIKENTKSNELRRGKLSANEEEIALLKAQMLEDNQLDPITWGQLCYDDLCKLLDKIGFEVSDNQLVKTLNDRSKYSNKSCAIYQGGVTGKSSSADQLCHANHIAIDELTQYIYVSDFKQNSIIVFDSKADVISTISMGIKFPRAITCKNDKLYLIENLHSMRHVEFKSFQLTPKVSPIPSTKMKVPADLSHVSAFDVSQDENWYVCSRRANKVFLLKDSIFYLITSQVPFQSPTAIKVTEVLYLLECLSDGTSRIRLMNQKGETMDFIVLAGISEPMYFDVDIDGAFILSVTDQDTIVMYTRENGIIHKIQSSQFQSVSRPKGIAVNREGNVIVITNNLNGCLLVF